MKLFQNKEILEVGGPSRFFHKNIPIYQLAKTVSGVNFSSLTVWEGKIKKGNEFTYFKKRKGHQFISDATTFKIKKKFDVIISSNCIEHIANPLLAIENWLQHLKRKGSLLIVAPKKFKNFDHLRKDTEFSHLLSDYQNHTTERDLTHLNETLRLHDFDKTNADFPKKELVKMFKNNYKYRVIHHHVFNKELLAKIAQFFNCDIVSLGETKKNYYIVLLKK